ncbi:hypothetical protein ABW21_db0207586 [Orbilia brochopaga]|nr:hypothetical protein ABW21_db0207586 [Drechslerella brochopaga]
MFSTFVLESATSSSRLTYFQPPLNLLSLAVRPLRLILPAPQLRALRIKLLKATHFPLVAVIMLYEKIRGGPEGSLRDRVFTIGGGPRSFRTTLKAQVDKKDVRQQVRALMGQKRGEGDRQLPPSTPGTATFPRSSMHDDIMFSDGMMLHGEDDNMDAAAATVQDLTVQMEQLKAMLNQRMDELTALAKGENSSASSSGGQK